MKRWLFILFIICASKDAGLCQLCTGSLGDPMVNITFGTQPGPLKPGVTNLLYMFNNCPNDGQYTITNMSSSCFNNSWYTITGDHTGDKNGQLMLINASLTPNDFYVDTVSGLCGNTTFEFAAWVTNVLRAGICGSAAVKPNLTFRIETTDGTVLVKYDSGDIPSAGGIQWQQYGTFFTTPPGITRLVLRISNNAPGGCGNDLALDDITFRPCGPLVTTTLRVQQSDTVSLCLHDNVPLTMDVSSSSGFSGYSLQWQISSDSGQAWKDVAGATTNSYTHQANNTGQFDYRTLVGQTANFANAQCRVASSITSITVNPLPDHLPAGTKDGCTGLGLTLDGVAGAGYTYQWSGPNQFSSTLQSPVISNATYNDSGLYKVLVHTVHNCSDYDSMYVKMYQGIKAVVTNVSPICEGTSVMLNASGGLTYKWSPTDGLSDASVANPIASPLTTTVYQAVANGQHGCADSAQTTVIVYPVPHITAGPDKQLFEGESVSLDGNISGAYNSFYWTPTTAMYGSNTLSPTVSPVDSIIYTLSVVPVTACPVVSDNVFIRVFKKLNIPNAFSPNGDGINDTWRIKGLDTYPDAIVTVFDRKGITLYRAGSADFHWDGYYNGKPLPVDTYYYVVEPHLKGMGLVSGWVVILR